MNGKIKKLFSQKRERKAKNRDPEKKTRMCFCFLPRKDQGGVEIAPL